MERANYVARLEREDIILYAVSYISKVNNKNTRWQYLYNRPLRHQILYSIRKRLLTLLAGQMLN